MKKTLILTLILALCLTLSVPAMASEYDTYADALYSLGLFKGTGTDASGKPIFALDENATRLQSLIMLIRLLGEEDAALRSTETHPFADVPEGHWAYAYVAYGYARQYTSGTGATTFSPDAPATANMYLTYLLRALGYDDAAGDFSYDRAIAKAVSVDLIPDGTYSNGNVAFKRDDCAYTSFLALGTKMKGSANTLARHLEDEGVFTAEDFDAIRLTGKRTVWLQTKSSYSSSEGYSSVWTNTYDSQGKLLSEQGLITHEDGSTQISTHTYNNKGDLISVITKYSDGSTDNTLYTYDNAGNLITQAYRESGGYTSTAAYTYDSAGNVLTELYSNSNGYQSAYAYTYDSAGQMLTTSYSNSDGESSSVSYVYNGAGDIASSKRTYTYGETTEVTLYRYTYDGNGNRLTEHEEYSDGGTKDTAYTYDSNGYRLTEQAISSNGFSYTEIYTYDDAGNWLTDTYRDSDGYASTYSYTYDSADRCLSEAYSNSYGYGYTEVYTYDSAGNMISDIYQDTDGDSTAITHTYDSTGNHLTTHYVSADFSSTNTYEYIAITVVDEE